MSSHVLKLTGSAELPEPIELDKDYLFSINAGVVSITKKPDEAGSYEYHYGAKMRTCEVLKSNGEIIKAKVKGSISKKVRFQIMSMKDDYKPEMDAEDFYQKIMGWVLENCDEVIEKALR